MSDPSSTAATLAPALVFLGAGVVAAPLFRFLGLGATVGYLVAGGAIGPSGVGLISQPDAVLAFSELGVVMLLFLIGLEIEPDRLIAMRREIVGFGLGQMASAVAALAGLAALMGLGWRGALVAGVALSYSATSIALQTIEERGALGRPWGRRALSILLLQDASVAPVLAAIPLLAGAGATGSASGSWLGAFALAAGALAALVVGGLKLLNPFFALLARAQAREAMTAGALFVVLGAAAAMEAVGLSMALGAFLAGLLLSESNFRHQLEADIEPFRGLLMGLFFLSVGMTLDLRLVLAHAPLLLAMTLGVIALKLALAFAVLRAGGSTRIEALATSAALTPAGEFSFVLFPLAAGLGLVSQQVSQLGLATAALTMLVGPLIIKGLESLYLRRPKTVDASGTEAPQAVSGAVLVIGFGRFGQIANQVLLAAGFDVTVIDANVERIRAATRFGFRVYYGDGARLDVLRAAGAADASVIAVCIDDRAAAAKIVASARAAFPHAKIFARAYDRVDAIALTEAGADYQMRETFESALAFAGATVAEIDGDDARAQEIVADIRARDRARLIAQLEEGRLQAGGDYVYREPVRPEPLTPPDRQPRPLNEETRSVVGGSAPARPAGEDYA